VEVAVKEFFYLSTMLTPKFITFLYWIMLFFAILSGLGVMTRGGVPGIFAGLVAMAFGCVASRVLCELLIVVFKIHENLKTIAEKE
jgi:hypothetical protein